jgi:GNAT superfamily N-acetyltransferase
MRIETSSLPAKKDQIFRQVKIDDASLLGTLMDSAYKGTIDYEGESLEQCIEEMTGTLTGKYGPFLDFASFAVFESGKALSASLVTLWKEKPLLAFSMTDSSAQGKGHAGFLIERSINALAEHGHPYFYLVVTEGNLPAERLYLRLGFVSLGPALPKQPPPNPS